MRPGRKFIPNEYRVEGEFAFLKLTQGQEAKIDLADLQLALTRRWYADRFSHTYYAAANDPMTGGTRRTRTKLHRFLTNPPDHLVVDHDDGNGLNNTRLNLLHMTHVENSRKQRQGTRRTRTRRTICGIPVRGFGSVLDAAGPQNPGHSHTNPPIKMHPEPS